MNTPQTVSLDIVKVSIGKEKFKTTVEAEGHTLTADEPISENGTGQGMNPYTLLLASLGTCTAMTLRLYADRKGWALDDIEIELMLEKTEQNKLPVTEIME